MPAPATIHDFLTVVRKSNQVDAASLGSYLRSREEPLPQEPRKFAAQLVRDQVLTLFQAEQFLQGKYKGFTLGGYRILERLGTGGSGTVYLAEHEMMQRRVALKVLPTPAAENPLVLERFRREARAAAVLDHPNIVRFFDYRQEAGLHFLVMEYVKGPTLQQVLTQRGPLPIGVACEYVRQAALGLHHAHEQGLVHRDIKPANLLVDTSGVVKVLDMGLARLSEDEDSVTRKFNSNVVLGTADYLSPEQAMDLHNVDGRADLYSLGATLYALLTGKAPFHDGTIGQKLMWHQTRIPDPVSERRPEVPAELCALVQSLLAKKPTDRPESAVLVAETLTRWSEDPAVKLPSSRTLNEIHLDARTQAHKTNGGTSRLLPGPSADTKINCLDDDTRQIESAKESVPAATLEKPRLPAKEEHTLSRWLVLGVAVFVVSVAAGALGVLLR